MPRDHKEQIERLWKQGLRPAEIGRRLGITRQAVSKALKGIGLVEPRTNVSTAEEQSGSGAILSSNARAEIDELLRDAKQITVDVEKQLREAQPEPDWVRGMLAVASEKRQQSAELTKLWRWRRDLLPVEEFIDKVLGVIREAAPDAYDKIVSTFDERITG